jgi:hypothetical protein
MFVCYNAFMINNDTSSCIPWQWTACAVVTACIDIGLFVGGAYYLSSQSTIAYSLLGGGAFTLVPLICCLVKAGHKEADATKKNQESKAQDPVVDTKPDTSPLEKKPSPVEEEPRPAPAIPEKKELQVNINLRYQPESHLLESYAQSVGSQENAFNLLKNKGDYAIFNMVGNNFEAAYIDDDHQVKVVSFSHPQKVGGNIYKHEYEKLKFPQVPKGSQVNRSHLHDCITGFKFLSLVKTLDEADKNDDYELPIGVLQEFLGWLEKCPEEIDKKKIHFRFNPGIFLKVIGHTFGLLGQHTYLYKGATSNHPKICHVSFEGFNASLGKKVVMKDIKDYVLQFSQFSSTTKEKITKMCEKAYVVDSRHPSDRELNELMDLLNQDIPITIMGGWEGHSVNFTLNKKKKELFFINKGQHCGISPGLHKFKIGQEITKDVLFQILQLNHASDYPNGGSTENRLSNILKLEHLETVKSSYQKVGCCVFASNRLCLKAAALLLEEPFELVQDESKSFTFLNRMRWFNCLITLIKKEEYDEHLETELYFVLFCIFHKLSLKLKYRVDGEIDKRLWERFCNQFVKLKVERKEHPYLEAISDLIDDTNTHLHPEKKSNLRPRKEPDMSVFTNNHFAQIESTTARIGKFYEQKRSR